jgi:hypothetical protein
MDLLELAKECPQMSVTVRLCDLLDAGEALARRIAEITEEAVSGRASELGERLIPAKEARAALGNPDPSTMYRWSVLGYLTPVKIGVRNYYKASDLERVIRAHSIQVKP